MRDKSLAIEILNTPDGGEEIASKQLEKEGEGKTQNRESFKQCNKDWNSF